MAMKKLVKAYGNGAHVVLPVNMLGKEVYIMDDKAVKKWQKAENNLVDGDADYIAGLIDGKKE